ncbi:Nramp family divalent metal transporter [Planctomicrobium sp. SH664]|uniref:Nramp family divalent metal transporter n=1 Tax=Planctomicrobium sp. SH664 TaxID=3448125 RepID=UPI003F5B9970
MSDAATAVEFDPYALPPEAIEDPPASLWLALRQIGPGIILAGTIIGSGELILTTALGAEYGYLFLWLILFSCFIKVFVQLELGRYAISSGQPTLGALNNLKGPRLGAHILVWWWLFMMLATLFQIGAMGGGVGQSLNLAFPQLATSTAHALGGSWSETIRARPEIPWAFVTCLAAIALLWSGSYRRIEHITTFLVVGATVLTVTAVLALPSTPYPVNWSQAAGGLIPSAQNANQAALLAAFGVFGITGVGATELFYYPYWCLEKGYARAVGRVDDSPEWERRAKGWIRVMYLDAWVSMVVFTISTVAFYFMGAAVLHPQNLHPKGPAMIETLSRMFIDSIGPWTRVVFLIGAGSVLFKTLYLASAANARLLADFLNLAGFVRLGQATRRATWIHWLSLLIPIASLVLFLQLKDPKLMVAIGGCAQALTLPMLSISALYFRYRKTDPRLAPSRAWDVLLWIAVLSITIAAMYAVGQSTLGLLQLLRPAAASAP